ncbi:unnamed protein product, partial [Meganyctiphanes norvegica]
GYIKSAESVSNIESQVMADEMIDALSLDNELREKEKWAFNSSDKDIIDLQEGNQETLSGTRYKENELTNPAHSDVTNKSVSDTTHATVSSNDVEITKQINKMSEQTKKMSEQNNKLSVHEEVNQVAVGHFIAGVVPSAAENDPGMTSDVDAIRSDVSKNVSSVDKHQYRKETFDDSDLVTLESQIITSKQSTHEERSFHLTHETNNAENESSTVQNNSEFLSDAK